MLPVLRLFELKAMSDSDIPSHLVRSEPEAFPYRRQKWGRGYRFLVNGGSILEDSDKISHLKAIPVPATWSEVRICDNPNGHILAVGYDGSDKLQYLYHPDFLAHRNRLKFEDLPGFGMALPRIRRRLRKDLQVEDWNERRLLALIVKILDKHHLRIGSRVYARKNQSFGLTTLRKKHLREVDSHIKFEFTGKSDQLREIQLSDPHLVALVEELSEFSGWELFSFVVEGKRISADAQKVNRYIREITGGDYSARNFRTWAGTVLTVKYHPKALKVIEANPRKKLKATLVDLVAQRLGNTPAICEEYYIHPRILELAQESDFDSQPCDKKFIRNSLFRKHECRTLEILTNK